MLRSSKLVLSNIPSFCPSFHIRLAMSLCLYLRFVHEFGCEWRWHMVCVGWISLQRWATASEEPGVQNDQRPAHSSGFKPSPVQAAMLCMSTYSFISISSAISKGSTTICLAPSSIISLPCSLDIPINSSSFSPLSSLSSL